MQTRKPEIEQAILKQAEQEFYAHGFERASIRRIIKSSDTSIGNFYNYFESKDALFEALVGEEFNRFSAFITRHEQDDNEVFNKEIFERGKWKSHTGEILDQVVPELISRMIPDFNLRLVILLEGSKGTKYETASRQLLNLISDHFSDHAKEEGVEISRDLNILLAEQFLSGIIRIIKLHMDDNQKRNKLLTEFVLFFFAGAMSLFGQ